MTEHPIDQRLVERIFMQVSVAVHEAEAKVDTTDFDERIQNYRRKKWVVEGLDPDEQEEKWQKELKKRIKDRRNKRKRENDGTRNEKITEIRTQDERFKDVDIKKRKFKRKNAEINQVEIKK